MAPNARAAYLRVPSQHVALNTAPLKLQQAVEQVEVLQQALAKSQHESIAAQQQVALLAEANARLSELAVQHEQDIAKVRHFAYHDELTGLPNRSLLLDRLTHALVRAGRQQTHLALLLLDLDGFKDINDRFGHAVGDRLLQRVAERLLSSVRGGDTVCRYGGTRSTHWGWHGKSAHVWPNLILSTNIRLRRGRALALPSFRSTP